MNKRSTILIIEMDEENRKILKNMLQNEYDVIEAVNGREGLCKLRSSLDSGVAAVILDLVSPEAEGMHFLEEYNRSEELKSVPVIVTIAVYDSEEQIKCMKMNVWYFIRRPYNEEIIRFRIKNCIERNEFRLLKELKYRENFDGLTGIYLKNKFFAETGKLLEENPDEEFVFIRIDINKFQLINQFYGIEEGDKLIQYIADMIMEDAKNGVYDTYGRIEADVFCLCGRFRGIDAIESYIKHVYEHVMGYGLDFEILPVFGVYLIKDHSESVNNMYDKSNLATKQCKGNYMQNYCIYEEQMSKDIVREQRIVNNMRNALETEQFELYLQPKYQIKDNKLKGAEVLVRWRDPEKGMISPAEFIPVFEHNGFIMKLDYYVWEHTCMLLKKWMESGKKVFPVSVNISRVSLYNPRLVDLIVGLIHKYDIPPYLLQLELTESAYTNNPVAISEAMKQLQEKGFVILMDDFGSGYSSLNVLKDITVDILKIDMRFLTDNGVKERGKNILASVIRMAKWLKMPVIAEGVERAEQVDFLKSIGCEYVQGYYFARPMPVKDYEKLAYEEFPVHVCDNDTVVNKEQGTIAPADNIFSNMIQAVAICEYDGEMVDITRVNNAYYDLFGYEDMSNAAIRFMDTVDDNNKEKVLDTFKQVSESKGMGECEFVRKFERGKALWVNMQLKYINNVGTRAVIYATMIDITEQKRADLELRKYRMAIDVTQKDRETLMVVADEEVNRAALRCIFEDNYNIIEASNGKEALEKLKDNSDVDLILLDTMIPVMDGENFMKIKNTMEDISSIPVIIITEDDTTKWQADMLSMGASDYIVKPFIPETVIRRVTNVLESTRNLGEYLQRVGADSAEGVKDELTGLYTGKEAGRLVENLMSVSKKLQAMILINITNYNEIIRDYGRIAGDKLLKTFADRLTDSFRKSDIIARYSGNEFMVFVSGMPTADLIVERCQGLTSQTVDECEAELDCSIGVALVNDKKEEFASILEKADNALYIAKNRGKNQCVIYEEY